MGWGALGKLFSHPLPTCNIRLMSHHPGYYGDGQRRRGAALLPATPISFDAICYRMEGEVTAGLRFLLPVGKLLARLGRLRSPGWLFVQTVPWWDAHSPQCYGAHWAYWMGCLPPERPDQASGNPGPAWCSGAKETHVAYCDSCNPSWR